MGESMKRLFIMMAAVLLTALTVGCAGNIPAPTEPAATEAPTDAPYIDTQVNEPEWTLAEGELQLSDDTGVVASGSEILYFAIVSIKDGHQDLRFRLSDEKAAVLKDRDSTGYVISLNGEKIGNATLNSSGTVATVTAADAEGEITALATKIRGLYN